MKRIGEKLQCNAIYNDNANNDNQEEWTTVDPHDKKKWPKMSRKEAHERWDTHTLSNSTEWHVIAK